MLLRLGAIVSRTPDERFRTFLLPESGYRISPGKVSHVEEGRMKTNETPSRGSRRTFLQLSAAATAAMAFRIVTEPELAAQDRKVFHPGAVVIESHRRGCGGGQLEK